MIRATLLGAASAVVLWSGANAADLYTANSAGGYYGNPAGGWTGFYAGVNGGGAWGEYSDQLAFSEGPVHFEGLSPSGAFGGGQLGYNWQGIWYPNLVFGIEADIEGADVSDSKKDIVGDTYTSRLDYFGTLRGRIGFAADNVLIYATGGFAYGGIKNEAAEAPGPHSADLVVNTTATGYAVGGGVEYKIFPAWSFKAEYQYINLGRNEPVEGIFTYSAPPVRGTVRDDAFNTFRVGLNYHLVPGYQPLK